MPQLSKPAAPALDGMAREDIVTWQPLSMLPVIADLIDGAITDIGKQVETFTQALAKPHVFDDATIDRATQMYREQFHYIEIYTEQLRRWRTENPTVAQRQEIERLETQNSRLRKMNADVLAAAAEIRKGTIDRIMEKSDLQLGLEALADFAARSGKVS
jgi:hypothetical protein